MAALPMADSLLCVCLSPTPLLVQQPHRPYTHTHTRSYTAHTQQHQQDAAASDERSQPTARHPAAAASQSPQLLLSARLCSHSQQPTARVLRTTQQLASRQPQRSAACSLSHRRVTLTRPLQPAPSLSLLSSRRLSSRLSPPTAASVHSRLCCVRVAASAASSTVSFHDWTAPSSVSARE